jgi:hypothetical protein
MIGAMIAVATASSISQMTRARNDSRARQQAFQRADSAAARIAMDLASVIRRNDPLQQKLMVLNGGSPGAERDELLLLITSHRPLRGIDGEPEGGEYEVQYRVQPGMDGRDALWRRMDIAYDDYIDGGGIATPIAGSIVSLSVLAADSTGEWLEAWDSDSDGMPHAVKVVVAAGSDDGRTVATAMRIVAIDRVPLPLPAPEEETEGTEAESASGGAR